MQVLLVVNSAREARIKTEKGKHIVRDVLEDLFNVKQGDTLATNALRVSMWQIQVLPNAHNIPIL